MKKTAIAALAILLCGFLATESAFARGRHHSPAHVEQYPPPASAAQPSAPAYWYFCADSRAYYPYVKECASGWQRVAPQPG